MNPIGTCTSKIVLLFAIGLSPAVPALAQQIAKADGHPAGDIPRDAADKVKAIPPGSHFVLGAADVIHVNVWKNLELSQTVTVGPDGFVSLPLLGDVQVAGLTAEQLADILASRLSAYIVNPQVTVSVVDIRSRQVYVLGQVGKPGGFPLIAPIHVLQLIAQAGGLNTFANRKAIVVLRPEGSGVKRIPFNYNNVIRGDGKQNIMLQPGDTVVVP